MISYALSSVDDIAYNDRCVCVKLQVCLCVTMTGVFVLNYRCVFLLQCQVFALQLCMHAGVTITGVLCLCYNYPCECVRACVSLLQLQVCL